MTPSECFTNKEKSGFELCKLIKIKFDGIEYPRLAKKSKGGRSSKQQFEMPRRFCYVPKA